MIKLIDTHSHIFTTEFDEDRSEAILRAKKTGIKKILLPNIDVESIPLLLKCCEEYPQYCLPMMGLHPTSVDQNYKSELEKIRMALEDRDDYVAIGEVGIDLYWDKTYQKEQKEAFEEQVNWSIEKNLPLSIHSRSAFEQIDSVLSTYKGRAKGVFHCFSGDTDEARRMLDYEGFYLGINGVVTFKNSILQQTLLHVPLERLVIETDCPYLAPVPYRGKRNESAYVNEVIVKISEIYQKETEQVAEVIFENTKQVFGNL
jgi:TatD DNase family protein